ncbi:MAG: Fe-S cluster assembly protein SufD [Candidatus Sericytochromatia bacterium]|nr:Fe-S cluster assembly protein SufD [Candidatus Sericytochromatia bacterium]
MTETLTTHWMQAFDATRLPQHSEPEWLLKLRKQAFEVYLDMPEPPPPQRGLRRIPSLKVDELSALQPMADTESVEALLNQRLQSWLQTGQAFGGQTIAHNGQTLQTQLKAELEAQGAIFCSLHEALVQHPEQVQKYLGSVYPAIAGRELALNLAYWQTGYFLYLPRQCKLSLPLYALQSLSGSGSLFQRSLVVLEAGAELTLVHDAWSAGQAAARVSDVLEIQLGDGAVLNQLNLQQWEKSVHCHSYSQAQLGRDARYHVLNLASGSLYHYLQTGTGLAQKGAEARLLGLFVASGEQHFRQQSLQNHLSPHTVSHLQYHGVMRDQAYSFYNGMIYVAEAAQQTESNQLSKNLLLSEKARADAIPNLEILADDVQSGHGAAIGAIDRDQLFYLMSRGFGQTEAEALITEGFMEEVLLQFPDARLHAPVQQLLAIQMLQDQLAEAESEG